MLRRMGTGTGTDACWSKRCAILFRKIKPPPISSLSLWEIKKIFLKHNKLRMSFCMMSWKRIYLKCSLCTVLFWFLCGVNLRMVLRNVDYIFSIQCCDRRWVHISKGKHSPTRSPHVGTSTGTCRFVVWRLCRKRIRILNCCRLVLFVSFF
jgi:hypothetical protein